MCVWGGNLHIFFDVVDTNRAPHDGFGWMMCSKRNYKMPKKSHPINVYVLHIIPNSAKALINVHISSFYLILIVKVYVG